MSYTPNFNDPRVVKRITHALGFASASLTTDKSRQWTTRELDKHIGRSWHSLGKYLRDKLLICTNDVYWFGTHGSKCKEYRLNHRGYEELTAQFKINNNFVNLGYVISTNSRTNTKLNNSRLVIKWTSFF